MRLVFQDPYASLNPRMNVLELVAEPLVVDKVAQNTAAAGDRVSDLLDRGGLPTDEIDRHPHTFSGGQRRRIVMKGEIRNPITPPTDCRFQTRCPLVEERCRHEMPPLEEKAPGHLAVCFVR